MSFSFSLVSGAVSLLALSCAGCRAETEGRSSAAKAPTGTFAGMDLYLEVQRFYAGQLPLLERRRVDEFASTYTHDGVFEHASGLFKLEGREQIAGGTNASLEHYGDKVFRHWTNHLRVEPVGDEVHAGFTAIVSVTDQDGRVTWEPSCTVNDILVRHEGRLLVRSRVLQHDVADMGRVWAGQLADAE